MPLESTADHLQVGNSIMIIFCLEVPAGRAKDAAPKTKRRQQNYSIGNQWLPSENMLGLTRGFYVRPHRGNQSCPSNLSFRQLIPAATAGNRLEKSSV